MPAPQFNVRVPERYHALLRLIVERLRANPDGADALADALLAVCRQPAGSGAIGADNLPASADSVRLDAIEERLGSLEQPILDRLAALEAKEDSLQSLLDRLTGLVEAHTDMLRSILDRLSPPDRAPGHGP